MKDNSASLLNIVSALDCEARALIQVLNLKKDLQHKSFQIYKNKDSSIQLIISGVGKINAAIATTYVATQNQNKEQGFLNVGIAGSSESELGKLYLVNKLQDEAKTHVFYPKVQFLKGIDSMPLETHDKPVTDLPIQSLVDMEAIGFYQASLKFTTQENIQVLKVVSDNNKEDQTNITSGFVSQLMQQELEAILAIITQMQSQLKHQAKSLPYLYEEIITKFHSTEQQRLQLLRLLQRAEIFGLNFSIAKTDSLPQFIKELQRQLEGCY